MIPHWIPWHARTAPYKVAVVDETLDRSLTYAELAERIGRIAGHLRERGIRRGDRVAILARNSHLVLELQYACAALGAVFVPLNWRLSAVELRAAVDDCGPRLVLREPAIAHDLGIPELVLDPDWELAFAHSPLAAWSDVSDDDPWSIIYTSGTTGTPKGVIVSHGSARATMLSVVAASRVGFETVSFTVLPFCHVAGLNLFTNPTLFMGGTVVLLRDFAPERALEIILQRDITHLCGVPAVFQFMQALPAWSSKRFDGLRIMIGGAPVPDGLLHAWTEQGASPQTVYGISEAGAAVLMVPDGEASMHLGTVGRPLMHVRIRIVDEDGEDVPDGTVGQLLLAGPSVTPGYWANPELTAQTIVNGWLATGDAAVVTPEGPISLVDRFKDMYISGGENVYPAEVEAILYQHPAVAECAVVGVLDDRWGEVGHAFIVIRKGHDLPADALRAFAKGRLAGYKVPRHVTALDALPRNTIGKILKRELRQL